MTTAIKMETAIIVDDLRRRYARLGSKCVLEKEWHVTLLELTDLRERIRVLNSGPGANLVTIFKDKANYLDKMLVAAECNFKANANRPVIDTDRQAELLKQAIF